MAPGNSCKFTVTYRHGDAVGSSDGDIHTELVFEHQAG